MSTSWYFNTYWIYLNNIIEHRAEGLSFPMIYNISILSNKKLIFLNLKIHLWCHASKITFARSTVKNPSIAMYYNYKHLMIPRLHLMQRLYITSPILHLYLVLFGGCWIIISWASPFLLASRMHRHPGTTSLPGMSNQDTPLTLSQTPPELQNTLHN